MIAFVIRSIISLTTIVCLGKAMGGSIFAYVGAFIGIGILNTIMTNSQRHANATGDKSAQGIATFCFVLSIILLVVSIVMVAK